MKANTAGLEKESWRRWEICSQLDCKRQPGLLAGHGDVSRECIEERAGTIQRIVGPGGQDAEPTLDVYKRQVQRPF